MNHALGSSSSFSVGSFFAGFGAGTCLTFFGRGFLLYLRTYPARDEKIMKTRTPTITRQSLSTSMHKSFSSFRFMFLFSANSGRKFTGEEDSAGSRRLRSHMQRIPHRSRPSRNKSPALLQKMRPENPCGPKRSHILRIRLLSFAHDHGHMICKSIAGQFREFRVLIYTGAKFCNIVIQHTNDS